MQRCPITQSKPLAASVIDDATVHNCHTFQSIRIHCNDSKPCGKALEPASRAVHKPHQNTATTYKSQLQQHPVNVNTPQERHQQPALPPPSHTTRTKSISTDVLLLFLTCCERQAALKGFKYIQF
jgi:hypothetical protein